MTAAADRVKVPLRIRFLDPVQPFRLGREIRFEVERADLEGGGPPVPIDQLDFGFAPLEWGEVRVGDGPALGVVKVVAVAKPRDVYDRPKYELSATFKARGGLEVETVTRFALAWGAPVVELRFFIMDEERFDPFDPQAQSRPLAPAADFEVVPAGSADVFLDGSRFFARIHDPRTVTTVTVRFPNGEKAATRIDLGRVALGSDGFSLPANPTPVPTPAPVPVPVPVPEPRLLDSVPQPAPALAPAPPPVPPPPPPPPPPPAPVLPVVPAASSLDPSASLRREIQSVRREIDAALSAVAPGPLPPAQRDRLKKRLDFMRSAVQGYRGPDVQVLREFYDRSLGAISLG